MVFKSKKIIKKISSLSSLLLAGGIYGGCQKEDGDNNQGPQQQQTPTPPKLQPVSFTREQKFVLDVMESMWNNMEVQGRYLKISSDGTAKLNEVADKWNEKGGKVLKKNLEDLLNNLAALGKLGYFPVEMNDSLEALQGITFEAGFKGLGRLFATDTTSKPEWALAFSKIAHIIKEYFKCCQDIQKNFKSPTSLNINLQAIRDRRSCALMVGDDSSKYYVLDDKYQWIDPKYWKNNELIPGGARTWVPAIEELQIDPIDMWVLHYNQEEVVKKRKGIAGIDAVSKKDQSIKLALNPFPCPEEGTAVSVQTGFDSLLHVMFYGDARGDLIKKADPNNKEVLDLKFHFDGPLTSKKMRIKEWGRDADKADHTAFIHRLADHMNDGGADLRSVFFIYYEDIVNPIVERLQKTLEKCKASQSLGQSEEDDTIVQAENEPTCGNLLIAARQFFAEESKDASGNAHYVLQAAMENRFNGKNLDSSMSIANFLEGIKQEAQNKAILVRDATGGYKETNVTDWIRGSLSSLARNLTKIKKGKVLSWEDISEYINKKDNKGKSSGKTFNLGAIREALERDEKELACYIDEYNKCINDFNRFKQVHNINFDILFGDDSDRMEQGLDKLVNSMNLTIMDKSKLHNDLKLLVDGVRTKLKSRQAASKSVSKSTASTDPAGGA